MKEFEEQVSRLIAVRMGTTPIAVHHMPAGATHRTCLVQMPGRVLAVRTSSNPDPFPATEANLRVLAELGLPVPKVIDVVFPGGDVPFSAMILEAFPGRDLRHELCRMSPSELTVLAEQIVGFERCAGTLPLGEGFGYAGIGEQARFLTWGEFIEDFLNFELADEPMATWQRTTVASLPRYSAYFNSVPATCFLDDLTTKNVIIEDGELQGIVDFDCVCYGDPLWHLALATVAVVCDIGADGQFYVDELVRFRAPSDQERSAYLLYCAAFGLAFARDYWSAESESWRTRMAEAIDGWLEAAAP